MGKQPASLVDKPVVVIVGCGYGGISVAKSLEKLKEFNVVILDRKDYFLHNIGALRPVVVDQWEKHIVVPYSSAFTNAVALQVEVTKITDKAVHINGKEDPIKFDYLVIAVGSSYAFPAKIAEPYSKDVSPAYKEMREEVKKAQKILIIGAGPVGVELAGEISNVYGKEKSVTVVHSGERVMNYAEGIKDKLRMKCEEALRFNGVNLKLSTRIETNELIPMGISGKRYLSGNRTLKTDEGEDIETDLVFFANGADVNSSALQEHFGSKLSADGRLSVNDYMQVEGCDNVYAVGDCANKHLKFAYIAGAHGAFVAKQIVLAHKGREMKKIPDQPALIAVPVGKDNGAAQFPFFGGLVLGKGPTKMVKGNTLFWPMYWGQLGADKKLLETAIDERPVREIHPVQKANVASALHVRNEMLDDVIKNMMPLVEHAETETHI